MTFKCQPLPFLPPQECLSVPEVLELVLVDSVVAVEVPVVELVPVGVAVVSLARTLPAAHKLAMNAPATMGEIFLFMKIA